MSCRAVPPRNYGHAHESSYETWTTSNWPQPCFDILSPEHEHIREVDWLFHVWCKNHKSDAHVLRGDIQNISDWCRHLYSSCGSSKHRLMVGLLCLLSHCAKLHVAGWTWGVFTCVYLESYISLSPRSGNFWIHPRMWGNAAVKVQLLLLLICKVPGSILTYRRDDRIFLPQSLNANPSEYGYGR
jgi:hypothetical protein